MNSSIKENTQNKWISGDCHFNHMNLISGTSKWNDLSKCRQFESLEKHNETILNNINSLVKENDILYLLGDFCFGDRKINTKKYRDMINCKNIIYLRGNHESEEDNVKCFSAVHDYLEIKEFGKNIVLFHYPIASWNGMGKGWLHFHAHTHNNFIDRGRSKDVGLDTNDFKPYNLEELVQQLSKIEVWCPDHHVEVR